MCVSHVIFLWQKSVLRSPLIWLTVYWLTLSILSRTPFIPRVAMSPSQLSTPSASASSPPDLRDRLRKKAEMKKRGIKNKEEKKINLISVMDKFLDTYRKA